MSNWYPIAVLACLAFSLATGVAAGTATPRIARESSSNRSDRAIRSLYRWHAAAAAEAAREHLLDAPSDDQWLAQVREAAEPHRSLRIPRHHRSRTVVVAAVTLAGVTVALAFPFCRFDQGGSHGSPHASVRGEALGNLSMPGRVSVAFGPDPGVYSSPRPMPTPDAVGGALPATPDTPAELRTQACLFQRASSASASLRSRTCGNPS